MVKKKRNSIVVVHEGYSEGYFIEHISQFSPMHINLQPCYGDSAAHVLNTAFKRSDCGLRVIAFFDEDFELIQQHKIEEEALNSLTKRWGLEPDSLVGVPYRELQDYNIKHRNPVLAVSWPKSIEGLILCLVGTPEAEIKGKATATLKEKLSDLLTETVLSPEDEETITFYDNKIKKYNDAIEALAKDATNYKELLKSYNAKKQELGTKRNAVIFKRFLMTKVDLNVLQAKRNGIKMLDTLLKELGI